MQLRTLAFGFLALATAAVHADDYADLFEKVDPAVVVLYTPRKPLRRRGRARVPCRRAGSGSGFVIDREGHVMTAAHVVQTADYVRAEFVDGTQVAAEIIASNPIKDVALLKLESLPKDLSGQ